MAVYSDPNQVAQVGVSVFADGINNGKQETVKVEQEVKATVEIVPEFTGNIKVESKTRPSLTASKETDEE